MVSAVADVYAAITNADPALVARIAEVLELRAANPSNRQCAVLGVGWQQDRTVDLRRESTQSLTAVDRGQARRARQSSDLRF
jgi:hypothetical protein